MWKLSIKLITGDVLSEYEDTTIPHKDEFIYIEGALYKVISVCYMYVIKRVNILVEKYE